MIRCSRAESLVRAMVVSGCRWETETPGCEEPPSVIDTKWSLEAKEATEAASHRPSPRSLPISRGRSHFIRNDWTTRPTFYEQGP